MADQYPTLPTASFAPSEPDCFGRYLNLSDREVSNLLATLHNQLAVGEYDQGLQVQLPWDDVKDLLTIAEYLWRWHKAA